MNLNGAVDWFVDVRNQTNLNSQIAIVYPNRTLT
jgi:hypothetical protein